jgi:DNA-binding NtrC family response regulator
VRILAIEDETLWTELLGRALTRAGFEPQIERVMSEEELRSAVERGRWDMVVSDNRMPGFSAKEALAIVRNRDGAVPFVVMSGYLTEAQRAELEAEGASQFIEKGDLPGFVTAVRAALGGGYARPEHDSPAS